MSLKKGDQQARGSFATISASPPKGHRADPKSAKSPSGDLDWRSLERCGMGMYVCVRDVEFDLADSCCLCERLKFVLSVGRIALEHSGERRR